MIDYVLKNIDRDKWQDFRAVSALQGKTVRQNLLEYVESQGKKLTAMVICKDKLARSIGKEAHK